MSKLTRACIALAAFMAFAVIPATASASNNPILTAPTGTAMKTGEAITGTNVGHTVMTDANTNVLTECVTATMSGTVTKNDHGGVAGTITAASFSGNTETDPEGGPHGVHCKGSSGPTLVTTNVTSGLPYCLQSNSTMGTDVFQVRGGACNEAEREIRFILDVTSPFGTISCIYGNVKNLEGKFTTHPNAAVATIGHQKFERKTGSSFLCPAEGYLDMSFTLENSKKEHVYIHDAT